MSLPLSRLSSSELQSFEQSVLSEKNGMSDQQLDDVAVALGMGSQGEKSPTLSPDEQADRLEAEASYYEFTKQAWHIIEPDQMFIPNWHIQAMCWHLEELVFGSKIRNLLINVPPGSMKSISCSVLLVPWAWAQNPQLRFMYASYEQGLSTRDSVAARKVIQSDWYKQNWGHKFKLIGDQNEKTKFQNDAGGWRLATSVGGRGTGEHPDVLVVDDAHKVADMESETERNNVKSWWGGTISTRGKVRKVRRCVVGQRVHHDDISAMICSQNGGDTIVVKDTKRWDHIRLPMRYEGPAGMPATALGWKDERTVDGELLWDPPFDEKTVSELEIDLGAVGPDVPAGQLQQRPTRRGGSIFKREWCEIVDVGPAEVVDRVRYWDKAATPGGGAYTCGVKISLSEQGTFYIEDVVRGQVGPDGRHDMQVQAASLDSLTDEEVVQAIEQEPGSAGKDAALFEVRLLRGYNVEIHRPTGDKLVRLSPFISQAKAGNVKLVRGPWNEALLAELEIVPLGKYMDQADGCSGATAFLTREGGGRIQGELIASGEDPVDERTPFTNKELEELPDYLRDLVEGSKLQVKDRIDQQDLDDDGFEY